MSLKKARLRLGFFVLIRSLGFFVFCETLAGVSGAKIELYETHGALGAGFGAGLFQTLEESFQTLEKRKKILPTIGTFIEAYAAWKKQLEAVITLGE